jgi:hypothetical protein
VSDTVQILAGEDVSVEVGYEHQIETGLDDTNVILDNAARVEVEPYEYSLTSSGLYTGNLTGEVPTWVANYVTNELATSNALDTNPIVTGLRGELTTLENGVNQNVTNLATANGMLSALQTTVTSNYNEQTSSIGSLSVTVAGKQDTATLASDVQQSLFEGDVDTYIEKLTTTYARDNLAYSIDHQTLSATVGDIGASVTQVSVASVDEGEARAKHSLVVNADGNISGYVAEAGTTSNFEILADTFKVSNGTTKLPVFTVDTVDQKVYFNAAVEFEGLGINGGSTTIDGGKLSTDTAWIGGSVQSTNYSWDAGTPTGFAMYAHGDQDSGEGYNIIGGKIFGAELDSIEADASVFRVKAKNSTTRFGRVYYAKATEHNVAITSTQTLAIDSLYGDTGGSGLLNNRICDSAYSIVEISVSSATSSTASYFKIQRSVNGGTYIDITGQISKFLGGTHTHIDSTLPASFSTVAYRIYAYGTATYPMNIFTSRVTVNNT